MPLSAHAGRAARPAPGAVGRRPVEAYHDSSFAFLGTATADRTDSDRDLTKDVHFNLHGEPTREKKLKFSVLPKHLGVAF